MFDPKTADANTQIAVATFIIEIQHASFNVTPDEAERLLRERLQSIGHGKEYIESAIQYAYAAL